MNKIYNTSKDKFIAYNLYKSNKKNTPYVIFLHGLMSDMEGTKAIHIEAYCQQNDYDFIKFDNYGHGKSHGLFKDQTIGSWLAGLELIIEKLTDRPVILIGSSMSGWISLLAAIKLPSKVAGLICLAPAPDFTEESIWRKLPESSQLQMKNEGVLEIGGTSSVCEKYLISYQLIIEARNHLLLSSEIIEIDCPVHLIHGVKDIDIPYDVSLRLLEKIKSQNVVLKLVKDGEHNLSRLQDLNIITNSLEEVLAGINLKI